MLDCQLDLIVIMTSIFLTSTCRLCLFSTINVKHHFRTLFDDLQQALLQAITSSPERIDADLQVGQREKPPHRRASHDDRLDVSGDSISFGQRLREGRGMLSDRCDGETRRKAIDNANDVHLSLSLSSVGRSSVE